MGLIWWAIPALLALNGFSVETITTLGASATMPWSFKFLLGPVVDRFISTHRQHAWTIASLQIGVGLAVFSLLLVPLDNPLILYCVLMMSFFSAMQDVVIDAWAIASVQKESRGQANAAMQVGMLSGRWMFGAGLLVVLSFISFKVAVSVLLALILASIFFLFFNYKKSKQVISPLQKPLSFRSFQFLLQKKYLFLAFVAITTGFALEGFTSVISPYLVHYGLDREAVGWTLSSSLIFMILGSVLGGFVSDRIGAYKTFILASLTLATCVLIMVFYSSFSFWVFLAGVMSVYICIGFFTASSYTYYMNQSQGRMEASKFTFLMAMTNLCEVLAAFTMGRLFTLSQDYILGFVLCAVLSVLGLVALVYTTNNKTSLKKQT